MNSLTLIFSPLVKLECFHAYDAPFWEVVVIIVGIAGPVHILNRIEGDDIVLTLL